MPKILSIVGDFVEDYEAMVTYQCLTMLGYTVHTVSPGKKTGESVATAIHDFEGFQTYTEKKGHNFAINYNFSDVKTEDYVGLILPGGRSPEYLRNNDRVVEIINEMFGKKAICVICHGTLLLAAIGKKCDVTCYPACRFDVKSAGLNYIGKDDVFDNVVVDQKNKVVSTPAWTGHPEVLRKFVELLGASIKI